MTQKELLYVEDAIGHETNIISIATDISEKLEDEELVSFMEEQIENHISMKDKLMTLLEEKANE